MTHSWKTTQRHLNVHMSFAVFSQSRFLSTSIDLKQHIFLDTTSYRLRKRMTAITTGGQQVLKGFFRRNVVIKNDSPYPIVEVLQKERTVNIYSLDIDVSYLRIILKGILPEFSKNEPLVVESKTMARNLAATFHTQARDDNMKQAVAILEEFLETSSDLPASVVASVHTCIGLIRQDQNRYKSSIDSLVKALWMRTASNQPPQILAVALHRLGFAYSVLGDSDRALSILSQAMKYYRDGGVTPDHEFVELLHKEILELRKETASEDISTMTRNIKSFNFDKDEDLSQTMLSYWSDNEPLEF